MAKLSTETKALDTKLYTKVKTSFLGTTSLDFSIILCSSIRLYNTSIFSLLKLSILLFLFPL